MRTAAILLAMTLALSGCGHLPQKNSCPVAVIEVRPANQGYQDVKKRLPVRR